MRSGRPAAAQRRPALTSAAGVAMLRVVFLAAVLAVRGAPAVGSAGTVLPNQQGPVCLEPCTPLPTNTSGDVWQLMTGAASDRGDSTVMLQLVSGSGGCLSVVRVGEVLSAAGTDVRPCNVSSPLQRWVIADPTNGTIVSAATPSELSAVGASGTRLDINNHQNLSGTALEMAPAGGSGCTRWKILPVKAVHAHFQLQLLSWGAVRQCVWHVQCTATECGGPPQPPAPPPPNATYRKYTHSPHYNLISRDVSDKRSLQEGNLSGFGRATRTACQSTTNTNRLPTRCLEMGTLAS